LNCADANKPTMVIPAQPNELYVAQQFHLHIASEHTINGLFASAELHIVHLREGGDLTAYNDAAVLGFKIDAGAQETNVLFEYFLCGWESTMGIGNCDVPTSEFAPGKPFDPYTELLGLVADDWSTFIYDGGLTNPPCWEIVQVSCASDCGFFMILPLTSRLNISSFPLLFPFRPLSVEPGRLSNSGTEHK